MSELTFTRQQYITALMASADHLTEQGRELRANYLKSLAPSALKLEAQTYADGVAWTALCK
jgi:hypothetical protein